MEVRNVQLPIPTSTLQMVSAISNRQIRTEVNSVRQVIRITIPRMANAISSHPISNPLHRLVTVEKIAWEGDGISRYQRGPTPATGTGP